MNNLTFRKREFPVDNLRALVILSEFTNWLLEIKNSAVSQGELQAVQCSVEKREGTLAIGIGLVIYPRV